MSRPKKGVTFWDRVVAHVRQEGECHVFYGSRDDCGYGRIWKNGRLVRIHREIFKFENGPIPLGMVVRHKCDNPACINPSHLELGTQADNIADMDKRGRRRTLIGSQRSTAKLHEDVIPIIREKLAIGISCASIGAEYGVTPELIRHIKKGRIWRHA